MTNGNDSVQIPCPKCGRELKLPDRSLLGRKGKCPKCAHTFILEEPSTIILNLALPEAVASPARSASDVPPAPEFMSKPKAKKEQPYEPNFAPAFDVPSEFASIGQEVEPKATTARLRGMQKKNARNRNIGLAIGALALLAVGGFLMYSGKMPTQGLEKLAEKVQSDSSEQSLGNLEGDSVEEEKAAITPYAELGNPTHGKPIDLKYIPFGTQVVLNLHPAELWKPSSLGEEIRYCAPPIAKLIETTLFNLFKRKPEEVEELMICLIPGQRGTPPEIAAVAHLIEEQKKSQLVDQFGMRVDTYDQPVYLSGNLAYMIPDLKTLVVAPKSQVQEMVQAVKERHPAEQIDPLLPLTDRSRQVTVLLVPATLNLQDSWYPENLRPFVRNAVEWLGDEVETIGWSMNLTDELFYSEILIRHRGLSAKKYQQEFKAKLARLAEYLVSVVSQMDPKEVGKRMVIGRLPAMVEVYSMATIGNHGAQHVQFVTPLPDRAAPNLVLGTVLAWDESTRTDFSKLKPVTKEGPVVPDLVADRLKMKIDVDFRATPLFEAFNFIGGEIKTPIEVDGDSLKMGGFTKNIKQDFKMDSAPAIDAVVKIFEDSKGVSKNPDKNLVLVVDEASKRILVTTSAGAARKGLKPFEIKK